MSGQFKHSTEQSPEERKSANATFPCYLVKFPLVSGCVVSSPCLQLSTGAFIAVLSQLTCSLTLNAHFIRSVKLISLYLDNNDC